MLLEDGVYQEIRSAVAKRSPKWPDFLAIESLYSPFPHIPLAISLNFLPLIEGQVEGHRLGAGSV
jgi:hypothetical protein